VELSDGAAPGRSSTIGGKAIPGTVAGQGRRGRAPSEGTGAALTPLGRERSRRSTLEPEEPAASGSEPRGRKRAYAPSRGAVLEERGAGGVPPGCRAASRGGLERRRRAVRRGCVLTSAGERGAWEGIGRHVCWPNKSR